MRRAWCIALAMVAVAGPVRGQQRGSDVGGQVSRRKLTRMPRLVRFVDATLPPGAKAASVVLTIELDAAGNVVEVAVAKSAGPALDAAAVAAARQFAFEPAEVDDRPAPSTITYRYDLVPPAAEAPPPPAPLPSPPPVPPPTVSPPPAPDEVAIRGGPRAPRESVDYVIRAEQARKVAGSQGDVLKVIQNLPGVSRPPLSSGQIVVWGSGANETRVYVDGVDIPALYHGSALRGTINSDLVSTIDLVPGAFGAAYGRGLGGLVRVETKALPRGTHGYVGVDTLDASALVSTELAEGIRAAAGVRYGWLDRALALTAAPDVGDFFPIPRYHDGQAKVTFDLRKNESLDAVFLLSGDALDRTVPSADPARRRVEQTSLGFWRAYLRYTSVSEHGDTTTITPFVGHDATTLAQRFGATPARLDVDSVRYGIRSSLKSPLHRALNLVLGLDVLGTSSRSHREGSLSLPPREGDVYVFGQPPGDDYAVDRWGTTVVNVGPHVHADLRLGPVLLSPGLRYDGYLLDGDRTLPPSGNNPPIGFSRFESAIDPRVSARWTVTPRFALTAAFGTYHQAPQPEELSPTFGTPALALAKATHITVGESVRITSTTSLDVVAFDKSMQDLVVRTRLPNPIRARALVQNGEGRSYGLQFFLRQEVWRGFFGFVSYAITRSERRYEGDAAWRSFDLDQPHVFSAVASQELGSWNIGARFRYASGSPRSPVVGSSYDARNDRFDPIFGAQNTIRLPDFWQLDLRVDRTFALGGGYRLLAYVDLQNVTYRKNAEEYVYAGDYGRRDTIKGLPIIAVGGVRIER